MPTSKLALGFAEEAWLLADVVKRLLLLPPVAEDVSTGELCSCRIQTVGLYLKLQVPGG
jgi:hypothetical protein